MWQVNSHYTVFVHLGIKMSNVFFNLRHDSHTWLLWSFVEMEYTKKHIIV